MSKETWKVAAKRPVGGFALIRADHLFAVWWCYEREIIGLSDLRLWFALREVVARRCTVGPRRKPRFTTCELMELTGQRRRAALKASLLRLEQAGLVKCRRSSITFAKSLDDIALGDRVAFNERLSLIANHRRRVPVPRRVLRWLAGRSRRVLIASVLGHFLRLLYLRNGGCRADGNCKASWLAEAFAINVRSVKTGRRQLIECGLLIGQDVPHWYRNRYGWRGAVNLEWTGDESASNEQRDRQKPAPHPRQTCAKLPPPRQNNKLSSRGTNQKPACGSNGSLGIVRGSVGHLDVQDLRIDERTQRLFQRAVLAKVVGRGDRLNVFAAAEHALRVGSRNPAGLFVWLLVNRCWGYVTQVDEDVARQRLQRLDGSEPVLLPPAVAKAKLFAAVRHRVPVDPEHSGIAHISAVLQQCLAT